MYTYAMDWFEDIKTRVDKGVEKVANAASIVLGSPASQIFSDKGWTEKSSIETLLLLNECVSNCHKAVCGFKLIEMELERYCMDLEQLTQLQRKFRCCHLAVCSFSNAIRIYTKYGKKNCWEMELFSATVSFSVSARKMLELSVSFIDLLKNRLGDETAPLITQFKPSLTLSLSVPKTIAASADSDGVSCLYDGVSKKMLVGQNNSRQADRSTLLHFSWVEQTLASDDCDEFNNPGSFNYATQMLFEKQKTGQRDDSMDSLNFNRVDQSVKLVGGPPVTFPQSPKAFTPTPTEDEKAVMRSSIPVEDDSSDGHKVSLKAPSPPAGWNVDSDDVGEQLSFSCAVDGVETLNISADKEDAVKGPKRFLLWVRVEAVSSSAAFERVTFALRDFNGIVCGEVLEESNKRKRKQERPAKKAKMDESPSL